MPEPAGDDQFGLAVVVKLTAEEIDAATFTIGGVSLLLLQRFVQQAEQAMSAYSEAVRWKPFKGGEECQPLTTLLTRG